jgi:hypothetical protein
MISIRTLALLIALIVCIVLTVFIQSSHEAISPESVKAYGISKMQILFNATGEITLGPVTYANASAWAPVLANNYTIESVSITIPDAFSDSTNMLKLSLGNFSKINFSFPVGFGDFVADNLTAIEIYKNNNPKDLLIDSSLFKNGMIPFWTQFNQSCEVLCKPFLKQTSYDTWEAKGYAEFTSAETSYNNENYIGAKIEKVIWTIEIPDTFYVPNTEGTSLCAITHGWSITKEANSGEVFHLVVKNIALEQQKQYWGIATGYIGIPSTLLGTLFSFYFERGTPKSRKRRGKR